MIIKDSKILRKLDYNDQGLINANITKNKLGISSKDDEFAKEQGETLYTILEEIVDMPNNDKHFVEQKLQPIIDIYYKHYGDGTDREMCNDQIIDDYIKDSNNLEIEIPRKTQFTSDELTLFLKNLYSQQLIDIEDDLDEEYEYSALKKTILKKKKKNKKSKRLFFGKMMTINLF
ncbi:hypothetical protein M9Y10_009013 [Tritrichomonas musculus]|uniref:Uncharacterized protein n=1 Tax=Tritrichomonas musculus TaxID=1915356 RepID=A0ABR2IZP9_9EUKA